MKKTNLRLNLVFNVIYQLVAVLSPLLLTPKLSRVFGPDYLGLKSYSFSIVYYFAIFGVLGLDLLGQRKIAIERDNPEKLNKIFSSIFYTRFLLVLISIVLYLCYIPIFISDDFEKIVAVVWVIYLIRELINPVWVLQGLDKYQIVSVFSIISQISYIVFSLIFINDKSQLPLYILFFSAIPLVISICYFPFVLKNVKFVFIKFNELFLNIKESLVYFVPTIATAIYSMIDKTMLGIFDSTKVSTGYYESAEKLVKVALAISTASFTIMRTRSSYLYGLNDKSKYNSQCLSFISFSMMLCWPIMFGIIGIAYEFVPVFFGSEFECIIPFVYVFSLVVPCLTVSGLLQAIYIFPCNLQKTMDLYYLIIVIINIAMNLLLIYFFGTIGAIISSVFAEFILALILIIKARNKINISKIFIGSIKYIFSALVMLLFMIVFSKYVEINIYLKLIIEFLGAVVIYFVCCIVLKDKFVILQLNKIIEKIKNIIIRKGKIK